jgi:hypothetical protein
MRAHPSFSRAVRCIAGMALVSLHVAGCSPLPPEPRAAVRPADTNFHSITIGLCEDYPKESRTLAAARRDLALLATNHIAVLRIAFSWLDMEPAPGRFDWSFWDDFVRLATDEYHIRLIPYVCYTPRWASSGTNDDFWEQPPRDNRDFAEFVRQAVARYHDRIHSWEIWNEPDNPAYWRGSRDQFAALLEAGSAAVHQTDPSANIVMGGLAWNPEFLEAMLQHPAALAHVNVINLHNYYETWSSEPLERIPEYVGRAQDLIRQYGGRQSLWTAEVGYGSFRNGPLVSGQYRAFYAGEHSPEQQASSLFRALTLLLATEKVSLIAWYRINDLPEAQGVIGDVNNRHLGLLDEHGRAKPSLGALQFFRELFPDGYRSLDSAVRIDKSIGAPLEVHAFQTSAGKVVIVAWLKTYVAGARGGDLSGGAADVRRETFSVRIPLALQPRAQCFDELGRFLGARPLVCRDGACELHDAIFRADHDAVFVLSPKSASRTSAEMMR